MDYLKEDSTFIIAEAGVNHNGSLDLAKELIDVAKQAGADAVKFQTFRAEELVCSHAPKAEYQNRVTSADESQFQMLKALELSEEQQIELFEYCQKQKIHFLSSPFDLPSADFLMDKLQLSLLKLGSGEITNLPLLLKIARKGVSLILSTGMSTLSDVEDALAVLAFGFMNPNDQHIPALETCHEVYQEIEARSVLQQKVALLHCTTEYPAPIEDVNLRAMDTMAQAFHLPVGYSDHTLGITVPIAAVARGAKIIEKHFTLDKTLSGPDHQASLEPNELHAMITAIREVEKALGHGKKIPTKNECKNRYIARKSIVAMQKIQRGEIFSHENIGCKRPGTGMSPMEIKKVLGNYALREYKKDECIE